MSALHSGRVVLPTNYGVPSLTDMAVHLGRMPRWSGGTRRWFSVLHHLELCDRIIQHNLVPAVLSEDGRRTERLAVQLHEVDEVCTGDISTLWKGHEQRRMVDALQARAYEAYMGFNPGGHLRDLIKEVDALALEAEGLTVAPEGAVELSGVAYRPPHQWRAEAVTLVWAVLDDYPGPLSSVLDDATDPIPELGQAFVDRMADLMEEERFEWATT